MDDLDDLFPGARRAAGDATLSTDDLDDLLPPLAAEPSPTARPKAATFSAAEGANEDLVGEIGDLFSKPADASLDLPPLDRLPETFVPGSAGDSMEEKRPDAVVEDGADPTEEIEQVLSSLADSLETLDRTLRRRDD